MILLCCKYAIIQFNPTKTVCITFGSKININEHVSINGFHVQWSESVRHIGTLLDSTLSDSFDTEDQCTGFVSKLISKCRHLQPHILISLFKTWLFFFYLVLGGRIRLDLKVVPLHGM